MESIKVLRTTVDINSSHYWEPFTNNNATLHLSTHVTPNDVIFMVNKLAHMSQSKGNLVFDLDIGKIQSNIKASSDQFDIGIDDVKKLIMFI